MVSLQVWLQHDERAEGETIQADQYGRAFDKATAMGAIRAKDCHGIVSRWIDGQWVSL